MSSKIKRVFVDADQMLYACGFASEGEEIANGMYLIKKKLQQIQNACDGAILHIGVQGMHNFRDDLDFNYKANRTSRKPHNYGALRDYLIDFHGAEVINGMETDDWVSVKVYSDNEGCIASPDKDLNNTPGWHYNYQKDKRYMVTNRQADRHLWYQMLMGDRVDNIKGLPYCGERTREKYGLTAQAKKGCGAASAKAIIEHVPYDLHASDLNNHRDVLDNVVQAYADWGEEEGMHEDEVHAYMEIQYKLLYMIRYLDDDGSPLIPKLPVRAADLVYQNDEE